MAPIDDAALVTAARDGDRDALNRLLSLHHPRLFAVCRRLLGNDADAADAAQEAMISIVRGLPRFDGQSSFGTWAYRIASNAALDEIRRRGRRPRSLDIDEREGSSEREVIDRRSHGAADAVTDRMVLEAALAGLREEFRVAVVLRDVADLDYSEIAEVLGVPPGTVRSRIARGRAALADALAESAGGTQLGGPPGNAPRGSGEPDEPRSTSNPRTPDFS
jgi:RNA polymerase sigma-70 factor, ECF subfamily